MRVGLFVLALLAACSRPLPPYALATAQHHAEADQALARGDRAAARRAVAAIIASAPVNHGSELRQALLRDAYFRLARIALDGNDARAAVEAADGGLALGGPEDLFAANLLVARGAAHEALGDPRAALDDYERAQRINQALLERTLEGR
jgi:hypothetical protein